MSAPDTSINWGEEPDLDALRRARELISTNRDSAITRLEGLASKGSAVAMLYLGGMYNDNVRKEYRDTDRSIYWYRMAFDKGSVVSSYYLGDAYMRAGRSTEAVDVLRWGADRKFVLSMWYLGLIYFRGGPIPKDINEAKRIWEESSALGHVRSKRHLADIYIRGCLGYREIPRGVLLLLESVIDLMRAMRRNPESDLVKPDSDADVRLRNIVRR